MKVKKIVVGIKNVKMGLDDFVKTANAIEKGKKVKKKEGVYFSSFEAFRKALTPKRLELLRAIRTKNPTSINHLAKLLKRNIKNVADDVDYLVQVGLVEKTKTNTRSICPSVNFEKIQLEIAV